MRNPTESWCVPLRMVRTSLVGIAVLLGALPAMAGGSWIDPYHESYEAGDTVTMRGTISTGQLGWIEDGPFYAYLRVDPDAVESDPDHPDQWPNVHATDVPLGELHMSSAGRSGLDISITFALPEDLPDGEYWVVYCNDPCTTGIGDLIGGVVYVGITAEDLYGPEDAHEHSTSTTVEVSVVNESDSSLQPEVVNIQVSSADVEVDDIRGPGLWNWVALGLLAATVTGIVFANRRRHG